MWRGPVYSGQDNSHIAPLPSPHRLFTQVFQPIRLKSGRYYQALGYPWPNIALNMVENGGQRPEQPAATDLCLSKAVSGLHRDTHTAVILMHGVL